MSKLSKIAVGKLLLIVVVVGLACTSATEVSTSPSPSLSPSPTPIPRVSIPDEGRPPFEAWRIIMQEFVENEDIDPRLLSDGAILNLLDETGDQGTSLNEARDLVIRLENVGGFFDVPGGGELKEVYEVWAYSFTHFVQTGNVTIPDLNEAAIEGMVQALGDPYTAFLTADDIRLDQEDLRGSFQGIGAFVALNDEGYLVVVAPIENTPAEAGGIKAGDTILEVNGEPTNEMSLRESILKIRGPEGTSVRLLIKHLLDEETVLMTIIRGEIPTDSVSVRMETDDIARIRIFLFTQRTPDETRQALSEAEESGAKAIIVDLRQNPGGLLAETVQVADQFLDGGLVLLEKDGNGQSIDWNARPGGPAIEIPLVVLVDQFSASGAEVLAGAIQDRGRATLIGAQTFGKGSVTHLRSLSDGSGLYVTFARWFTPEGRVIEGQGIIPDIEISFTEADFAAQRDPQLEEAIRYLEEIIGQST